MDRRLARVALTLTGAAIVGVSACEPANVVAARRVGRPPAIRSGDHVFVRAQAKATVRSGGRA